MIPEHFLEATGRLLSRLGSPPTGCSAAPEWFAPAGAANISGIVREPPIGGNPEGLNARGRVWLLDASLPPWAIAADLDVG